MRDNVCNALWLAQQEVAICIQSIFFKFKECHSKLWKYSFLPKAETSTYFFKKLLGIYHSVTIHYVKK